MVTYYNRKDLVKFGQYLLSEERRKSIESRHSEIPIEERLKEVYRSDIENFLDREGRKE